MSVEQALDQLRRTVYNSSIHTFLKASGLDGFIGDLYWRIQFALSKDTVSRTVGPSTAKFHILTRYEYTRFNDPTLHGEIDVLLEMLESIKSDDVFWDVGANVGLHACFVGKVVDAGSIVAFEPHSKSIKRLEENIGMNDINGTVCECALAAEPDTGVLELPEDQAGAVGSVNNSDGSGENTVEIELIPGDKLIESHEIPSPNVLKIDVDGGEMNVLRGMEDTLHNGPCRLIFCEIHPNALTDYGATEQEVREFLIKLGYDISDRDSSHEAREDAYFVRAEKKI
jgi:FkbM family methyltransferase